MSQTHTIPTAVSCPTRLYSTIETEVSTYPPCTEPESEPSRFLAPDSANDNICPSDPTSAYAVQLFAQETVKRLAETSATKIEGKVEEEPHSTGECLIKGIYAVLGTIGFIYHFFT